MKNQEFVYARSNSRPARPAAPSSQNASAQTASAQAAMAVMVLTAMGATEAKIVGRAPIPKAEVDVQGWKFRPWDQDTCDLPPIAWQRLLVLHQAGIRPVGYVIAHEPEPEALAPARTQLADGLTQAKTQLAVWRKKATPVAQRAAAGTRDFAQQAKPIVIQTAQGLKEFAVAATPVAIAAGKAAVMAAGVLGAVALGAVGVLAYAMAVDPILFVCLPADDGGDPVWVEVARWLPKE
jgi:hypothetical protein